MIDFDSARSIVLKNAIASLPAERIVLQRSVGRILAEQVTSPVDLPTWDYSAMDGYALRSADLGKEMVLRVAGECRTGHPQATFVPGTCLRIFTGATIPQGVDSIVMQEEVVRAGEMATFSQIPTPGSHIRRRGEDLAAGDPVIEKGTRLNPYHLGLLASVERSEVLVSRRPRVTILCTGDELRPPGNLIGAGTLAESNSASLAALVEFVGGEAHRGPIVRDERSILRSEIERQSAACDVIVTVGGVSVGDHDVVRPVLDEMGAEILFHKVRIKPGKPVLMAKWQSTFIVGLPGNPASAQVTFSLFAAPLIRCLAGDTRPVPDFRKVPLLETYRQAPGRKCFQRAHLSPEGVRVLSNQSSGASTSIAWSNALVIFDEDVQQIPAGAAVSVLSLSDL